MTSLNEVKGFSYTKLEKEENALKELFLELKEVIMSEELDGFLREKLSKIYPDYLAHLEKRQDDLFIKDCGILVVGDTSSGKSTLINLLLDENFLETHLFACTTMIFKIISSDEIHVKTYGAGKKLLKTFKDIQSREELKNILKDIAEENRKYTLSDSQDEDESEDTSSEDTPDAENCENQPIMQEDAAENLPSKEEKDITDTNGSDVYYKNYITGSDGNANDKSSVAGYKEDNSSDMSSMLEVNGSQRSHQSKRNEEDLDTTSDFLESLTSKISTSETLDLTAETLFPPSQQSNNEEEEIGTSTPDESMCEVEKDNTNAQQCREVEVYFPTPKLKGNVMIVDSPGFGENEELTQRLQEYLRNAVSFIFILDVNRAGGIQKDGIIKLLEDIREKQVDMFSFDPSDVIFVTNKWDAVPGDQKYIKSLKKKINRKITNAWPSIKKDHICTLSAARVNKSKKDDYLKEYKKLEKVILKVLEENENKRIKTHFRFLDDFVVQFKRMVMPRYGKVFLDQKEQKAMVSSTCKKLEKLKETCAKMQEGHAVRIQGHLNELAVKIFKYLQTDEFENLILSEEERKWSSYMKIKIGSEVARRIEEETRRVIQKEAEDLLKNEINTMLLKDYDIIKKEIHGIDEKISGLKEPYNIKRKIPFTAMALSGPVSVGIACAVIGIVSLGPVGGAIFAGSALFGLGFLGFRLVKNVFRLDGPHDTIAYTAYIERMIGYDSCTIREMLDTSFGELYRKMSSHLFQHVFPKEIRSIELSVEDLEDEYTILKTKREALKKLKLKLDALRKNVNICYKLLFE